MTEPLHEWSCPSCGAVPLVEPVVMGPSWIPPGENRKLKDGAEFTTPAEARAALRALGVVEEEMEANAEVLCEVHDELRTELDRLQRIERAAAPHITRAAQVAILREMADELLSQYAAVVPPVAAVAFRSAAAHLRGKADELERGQ